MIIFVIQPMRKTNISLSYTKSIATTFIWGGSYNYLLVIIIRCVCMHDYIVTEYIIFVYACRPPT